MLHLKTVKVTFKIYVPKGFVFVRFRGKRFIVVLHDSHSLQNSTVSLSPVLSFQKYMSFAFGRIDRTLPTSESHFEIIVLALLMSHEVNIHYLRYLSEPHVSDSFPLRVLQAKKSFFIFAYPTSHKQTKLVIFFQCSPRPHRSALRNGKMTFYLRFRHLRRTVRLINSEHQF